MEQIVIIKADGTKIPLFSRKNASCVSKAAQKTALLSEDIVSISLTSAVPLNFGIGDHILLYGKPYKLNQLPEPTKEGERRYTYDLKLEGLQYDLIDAHYHLPEDAYGETYYSDLAGHLQVLMWNINRIFPGKWVLGEYPENTEYKNITNSGKNCLQVVQELCSNYGVEFEITTDGKKYTLNFKAKVGITHTFTLKYGRGLGLYKLQRKNVNNSGIVTRLFVYGGTENLRSNYGHTRLCLPGTTRLTSYIDDENAIALYGVKEGEKVYDIKPQRVGTVTALGADVITFADNTMFDLNAKEPDGKTTKYLIVDTSAKIKFESGGLAGYEFDMHSYDHATKTFVINKFQDENGTVFPSETSAAFQIAVGDKYSISDIRLPDEYIEKAEEDLEEEGSKYLPTVSQPQVSYKLELTEGFFIKMWGKDIETEVLHVGDFIKVEDEQIGVNKAVRITQIERDLLKPHSYDITLSDTVTKTTTVRVWNELQEIDEIIRINNLADPAKARRRWKATQELLNMVFDPEGDYYSEKIKPLSIETQMLSVGAKSTQFTLQNIIFQPNYGGDANTLYVSNGTLVHYAIDPDGLKYWALEGATFSGLTPAAAFYIYARCPINGDTGNIILVEGARTVDGEAGYYNFLVGVLNSVVTDAGGKNPGRLVSLTYGSSTVNGRFIRTGRIESSGGGKCYFDLDNDEIGGVIKFVKNDGTIVNVTDVDDKANEVKDYINNTLPGILNEMQSQLDGLIEQFFEEYDPTTSNAPAKNWNTTQLKDEHLGDLFYNTKTGKVFRWVKNGNTYSWQELQDSEVAQALALANDALKLAGTKRRIFVSTPTTPYDIGDLWLTGGKADGILKRCIRARTSGSYIANDWVEAVYYDNTQTVIDGGIVTAGTVQLAGNDQSIKAGITGNGTAESSVRFWAGASYGNRNTAPYRVLQDGSFVATKGTITGTIYANAGTIGGFAIASGRIGVASSSGATTGSGFSLYSSFIKFSDSYRWASIGTNVLPSSTGIVGVGRFTNNTPNSFGTNYGILINVSGANTNIGIVSNGAIVCNSYAVDYGIAKLTPSVNTCLIPGDATKPTIFKLMPRFIYSNSGIGLPNRSSICTVLGISNTTAFAVRITIICDRTSTQNGYIIGRNTTISGMNTNYYPYLMDNNASDNTGKQEIGKGDIREYLLVWDGSSNYYAYLLNHRN